MRVWVWIFLIGWVQLSKMMSSRVERVYLVDFIRVELWNLNIIFNFHFKIVFLTIGNPRRFGTVYSPTYMYLPVYSLVIVYFFRCRAVRGLLRFILICIVGWNWYFPPQKASVLTHKRIFSPWLYNKPWSVPLADSALFPWEQCRAGWRGATQTLFLWMSLALLTSTSAAETQQMGLI